jgi:glycosyltransferase involved in cell wall biosynthesis
MKKEISVIIPTYNRALYLGEALASAFAQSLPPLEVIVCDDGSTDGTGTLVKEFQPAVRYLRGEHRGVSAARNMGIEMAQGLYIAFLDSDDTWLPDKLEKQAEALEKNAGSSIVFSHYQEFVSPECVGAPPSATLMDSDEKKYAGYSASTLLARRDVFTRAGLFDETLQFGEFIEWYGRVNSAGFQAILLPEVCVKRRIHPGNMTRSGGKPLKEYARLMKTILDRRRASGGQTGS